MPPISLRLYLLTVFVSFSILNQSVAQSSKAGEELGTPFGWSQEVRTVLTFKISDEVAQKFLPNGWTTASIPQGPAKGANLTVVFAERLATQDANGKAVGGEEAGVILSIASRRDKDTAFSIIEGYSDTQTTPGFYLVYKPAKVLIDRQTHVTSLSSTIEETWSVVGDGGEHISFHIAYEQITPIRTQLVSRNVSAVDANIRRTYRIDQGTNVILSEPSGVKRGRNLAFKASGGTLSTLFDGKEEMVSIVSAPWYSRQMFLPVASD